MLGKAGVLLALSGFGVISREKKGINPLYRVIKNKQDWKLNLQEETKVLGVGGRQKGWGWGGDPYWLHGNERHA